MRNIVKRVAAVHDLSGFGRSSLSAITPIISTMGAQVCAIPTAVLSTHTGGFENYSFVDLTDSMTEYINHWKSLNIDFDCIYTGFLGSPKQIDIITDFIDYFKKNDNFVVIDPVMADNGELYATMTEEMVMKMKNFIKKADIITPNFTEACFLLGENYEKITDEKILKDWMIRLSEMGPQIIILTSVPEKNEKDTSTLAYNKKDNKFWKVSCQYIPAFYPGTGDVFTSVIVGSLLNGDSLPIAIDRGVKFITTAIRASYGYDYPKREGVLLEKVLDSLKVPVTISTYELM
ncbi:MULTISPECIES: pyridoxamine kinase [Oceanotoga]|uniref:pyridoxal kinase n=1 Tax=Oceanotoga teriensis TaxID=515440 RepID=A0AA45HJA1_9BACT|nr:MULTISPECIES: pyridoxamine kinase [Oceanotoga]MDN5341286.1 pyridoxine kinase [Oceanotoga sp.]MDO7976987.1 pyridoxamine kinase [Oceanotoga teriensis]PWJ95711.1 pyridoxine kinase [Oceanotoga teriensis]